MIDFSKSRMQRDFIAEYERRKITKVYEDALKEVRQKIEELEGKEGYTAELKVYQYQELERQLDAIYRDVSKTVASEARAAMLEASKAAFDDFKQTMFSPYGIDTSTMFIKAPDQIVRNIVTGNMYRKPDVLGNKAQHWSLSKSIWGDQKRTHNDIHSIIARGVAQGKPVYEIAKDIEQYVTPQPRRMWDWGKVYPGTKKYVDYNAQRLVRTSVQHAYQQSVYETSDNPWCEKITWHSALIEGRTCPVCEELDGQEFAAAGDTSGKYPPLPDDHPNGLCHWSQDVDLINVGRRLGEWVRNPQSSPEISEYFERKWNT